MRKEDNTWYVRELDDSPINIVHINGEEYGMPEHFSGLTHAILLLVDAINDKPN